VSSIASIVRDCYELPARPFLAFGRDRKQTFRPNLEVHLSS
jgi:hypothetical protein